MGHFNDATNNSLSWATGVDPGFLERGFICINVWGLIALLVFSLKYPMK